MERLEAAGFEVDSSIFPTKNHLYGIPDAPVDPYALTPGLVEIPPTVALLGGMKVPFGGGFYLRALPLTVTEWLVRRNLGAGRNVVLYVHPWELDLEQPRDLPYTSFVARTTHYFQLCRTEERLAALLRQFGWRRPRARPASRPSSETSCGAPSVRPLAAALRWGSLLSGLEHVPFRPLNEASAVGNMLFVLLPLRLGEFARPVLISRRSSIRASATLTSVVLERIIDGIAVALLLEGTLWWLGDATETLRYLRWGTHLMLAAFLGLWAVLLLAHWQRALAVRWARRGLGWLSPGLAERVAGLMDSFVGAVRQVSGPRQFFSAVAMTVAIWVVNGLAILVLAYAFDCAGGTGGCMPLTLDVFQSFVVLGVTVLGCMIPAAPGQAGTFQAGVKVSLSHLVPAAVLNGTGLAFANVMWLATIAARAAPTSPSS